MKTCAHCGHAGRPDDPLLPYDPYTGAVMHKDCAIAAESGEQPRLGNSSSGYGLWQMLPPGSPR